MGREDMEGRCVDTFGDTVLCPYGASNVSVLSVLWFDACDCEQHRCEVVSLAQVARWSVVDVGLTYFGLDGFFSHTSITFAL